MKFLFILVVIQTFFYSSSFLTEDSLQFLPSLIHVAKGQEKLINSLLYNNKEEKLSTTLSLMDRNQLINYINKKKSANPLGMKYLFLIQSAWNIEFNEWKSLSNLYDLIIKYKKSKFITSILIKHIRSVLRDFEQKDILVKEFNSLQEHYPFEKSFELLKKIKINTEIIDELIFWLKSVIRDSILMIKEACFDRKGNAITFNSLKQTESAEEIEVLIKYLQSKSINLDNVTSQNIIDYLTDRLMEQSELEIDN